MSRRPASYRWSAFIRRWQYQLKVWPDYYIRQVTSRLGHMERAYRKKLGVHPNFAAPQTFNEKIGWMKLHYHPPLYTQLADKVAVREYVRARVGDEALIPCLGVWASAYDIPLETLPDAFVLKCNHDCGSIVICHDKAALDWEFIRHKFHTRLRMDYSYRFLEWQYRDIPPRVLAEALLVDDEGREPMDYKIFCFGGTPQFIQVDKDRHGQHRRGIFSPTWDPMPFAIRKPNTATDLPRPATLDRMLAIASRLTRDIPFCRVDLYSVHDHIYFGEMTFTPAAGLTVFLPASYDRYWGDHIALPPADAVSSGVCG